MVGFFPPFEKAMKRAVYWQNNFDAVTLFCSSRWLNNATPKCGVFFGKEPSFKPRRTVGVASHRSFSGGNNDAGWGLKRMGCFWMGAG